MQSAAPLRLRQVALLARDLEATVEDLRAVFGIEVGFRDPGVAFFGLANAVFPVGDAFLEIVSPARADSAGARMLAKRGGDCGYMVIVQVADLAAARARVAAEKVRIVFEHAHDAGHTATIHLHPRDTGGAILSLDASEPASEWDWAGPAWRAHVRTDVVAGIASATLASNAPAGLAAHWASLLDRPAAALGGGVFAIALDGATLRFVPAHGAGEALVGVELVESSGAARERALAVARERGLAVANGGVRIAGTELRFVDPATV
jgi:catechol 2,3-dioxygenase-like lactoylglutathione lyase family enzyme